jgi:Tfp pilus assembly protein PilO
VNSSLVTRLTTWQINLLGVVVCAALTAATWVTTIDPVRDKRSAATARGEELDDRAAEAKRLAGQVRQTTARLASVRKQLDEVRLNLQPAARVNQRIAEVTTAAAQCGLELSDVRPGRAMVGHRYSVQPIEMSGTGTFPAAVQFMRAFHRTFGDSGFDGFELAGNPAAPGAPGSFHFRVHWYVQPPGTASTE